MTILERTRLRVGSRIAVAVPMFHGLGFGMLMLTVSLGGTVLTRRRFDAEATLAQASLQRADAMSVVPIMLARILDLPQRVRARNPLPCLAGGDIQRRPPRSQPGATVHGCLRRRPLQRLRLHRGRHRCAGHTGRSYVTPRRRSEDRSRDARCASSTETAGRSGRVSPAASSSAVNWERTDTPAAEVKPSSTA